MGRWKTTRPRRRLALGAALMIGLTTGLAGMPAQAQIAAVSCGVSILDFSNARAHGGSSSIYMPGAAAGIGQINPAAASEWWQTVTPRAARSGWWPSVGGDHSSMGQTPRDGYFLLFDIVANSNQTVYSNQLTNLVPGQDYTVSLWLSSTYHANSPQVTVDLLDGGGSVVQQASPLLPNVTDNTATDLPWQQVSLRFTASHTTQDIHLHEARNPSASGADLGLDDISLTHHCPVVPPGPGGGAVAVPALDGAALWLAGAAMGGLGGVMARRRQRRGGR